MRFWLRRGPWVVIKYVSSCRNWAPGFAGKDYGLEVAIIEFEKGHIGRLKQNEPLMRFAQ